MKYLRVGESKGKSVVHVSATSSSKRHCPTAGRDNVGSIGRDNTTLRM